MNQRLLRILGEKTEHYPHALESKFPRILDRIMSLWDGDEIDDYFTELLISTRSDRAGFPPDVAGEIMHLSLVHATSETSNKDTDLWEASPDSFLNFSPKAADNWITPKPAIINELQKHDIPATQDGFFEAIEMGNRTAVALFIETQGSTEVRDNRGWTPLMMAVFRGHEEIADLLIQYHVSVNALDQDGNSALHWAAYAGHIPCAVLLIQNHAKIDAQNNFGWTPLMQATARNHSDLVALLINNGGNMDSAADDGYTALHKAVESGYSEIVRILIQQGANRNLRAINGETPYKLAIKGKLEEIIQLLAPAA